MTTTEAEIKLAAARLLFGDDLVTRLVEDQWNAVNDLSDPYQVKDNSARFSLFAASLSVDLLDKACDAIKAPMMDLSERRQATYRQYSKQDLSEIFKGNKRNDLADAERCTPFEGDPLETLRDLLRD